MEGEGCCPWSTVGGGAGDTEGGGGAVVLRALWGEELETPREGGGLRALWGEELETPREGGGLRALWGEELETPREGGRGCCPGSTVGGGAGDTEGGGRGCCPESIVGGGAGDTEGAVVLRALWGEELETPREGGGAVVLGAL